MFELDPLSERSIYIQPIYFAIAVTDNVTWHPYGTFEFMTLYRPYKA